MRPLASRKLQVAAVPQQDGKTPMHLAAATNKVKCLELLVSKGADIKAKDSRGLTPMDMAKARSHMVHKLVP
jgi:ankyrin repeat protein